MKIVCYLRDLGTAVTRRTVPAEQVTRRMGARHRPTAHRWRTIPPARPADRAGQRRTKANRAGGGSRAAPQIRSDGARQRAAPLTAGMTSPPRARRRTAGQPRTPRCRPISPPRA